MTPSSSGQGRPNMINVLFIEDSSADMALTKITLRRSHIHMHLHEIHDGQHVVELLDADPSAIQKMGLILLDFNLSKCSGLDILKLLKSHSQTMQIPVVMLSGSDAEGDINSSLKLGASHYLVKPFSADKFKQVISEIPSLHFVAEGQDQYLCVC